MLTFALMLVGVGVWAIYDTPPTNLYPDPNQSFSHTLRMDRPNPRGDRVVYCQKPTCNMDDQFIGQETLLVYQGLKNVARGIAIGQLKYSSHRE